MMGWTHRHARYLFRILSKKAMLYTEMITTGALLRSEQAYQQQLLAYHPAEHPIAMQLGGNHPESLAECAYIAQDQGYDEINLNVGCPSHQVRSGQFGAALMARPAEVEAILVKIRQRVSIPVTVKCRIGIDDQDIDQDLNRFVHALTRGGVDALIVHARKAWLHGMNPKANRTLPPLNYARVYQLKQEFPKLEIVINGGITSIKAAQDHLHHVDGVMLGRSIWQNPWLLCPVDAVLFGQIDQAPDLKCCLQRYRDYVADELSTIQKIKTTPRDCNTTRILQPTLRLFTGMSGAKRIRKHLCQSGQTPQQALHTLTEIISML